MIGREKVIKGLEKCKRCECDDCTEKGASQAPWDCPAYDNFVDSAIAILKEQEAVKPRRIDGKRNHFVKCGNCNNDLMAGYKFCPNCGKAVKWNE